jgi:hypothetical protein
MLPTCSYVISEGLMVTLYNTRFKYEFYVLSTQCIYIFCIHFRIKQRLLPYTALTYWICNWDGVFTVPYRLGLSIKQIVLFLNVNALVSSPWSLRMCWNVKFFHCCKAVSWATLTSLNISFCLLGCLSWLHLVNIDWGFATWFFFNGDVVISPMPQPPTLKDHGIPLCLPASLNSVWHGWSYQHLGCCKHRFWVHWCKQARHL